MDIFNIISLFGGLAFFLYGMSVMSGGLEKLSGGKLEKTLKKMTSNPFKSLLLGMGITVAIQSSSAMTVMLVGLVNSGIMQLQQTVGVIMGSNVGTTLTVWLFALAGIDGDQWYLKLLKPDNFSPIFALVGIGLIMISKKQKRRDIGNILVGFSVLMFGMSLMSDAVSPLGDMPEFQSILTAFNNPLLGVIVGAVFTGIIQSSAASVAILQALSLTGSISFGMAIPIIMGQNIGTCVTSMISSIGVNKNAKRVAAVHISFNIIGTIICLILYYSLDALFQFPFTDMPIGMVGIALCHSIFNVFTTLILLPFSKLLVRIAVLVLPDRGKEKEKYTFIDERLLNTPSFAISECNNMTVKMSHIANETINSAIALIPHFSEKKCEEVLAREDELDFYEDKLGSYLVKVAGNDLSEADSKEVSKLLHTIGDFERLGDHAVNLVKTAREMHEKGIEFSSSAKSELSVLTDAIVDIMGRTITAFEQNSVEQAATVEPLEQVIDGLIAEIRTRHITRLQKGSCTIELGFVLSDLLTNYERISDHCSNVAVAIIEVSQNSFDTHSYLAGVKTKENEYFATAYSEYAQKYKLK